MCSWCLGHLVNWCNQTDAFQDRFSGVSCEDMLSPDIGIMCWSFLFILGLHDSMKAIDSAARIPTNIQMKGKMTLLSDIGYASLIPNCSFLVSHITLLFLVSRPCSFCLRMKWLKICRNSEFSWSALVVVNQDPSDILRANNWFLNPSSIRENWSMTPMWPYIRVFVSSMTSVIAPLTVAAPFTISLPLRYFL